MSKSKHPKANLGRNTRQDLDVNPGIGSSKGTYATGEDPRLIQGDNTIEGDIGNDTNAHGGVDPRQRGRTNR